MESHPPIDVAAPGPEGLAVDVPCPGCQYNLHGLTVPRCPECGFTFTWQDVPRWLADREENRNKPSVPFVLIGGLLLYMFVVFLMAGEPLAVVLLALPIAIPLALSAFQAGLELLVACHWLGVIRWRRFRAWWEGVLIGYGLCAVTCGFLGRPMIILPDLTIGWSTGRCPTPLLLAITLGESFLVQWWVVGRRARQWNDPISPKRLAIACAVAKTMLAIPWSLAATGALAR